MKKFMKKNNKGFSLVELIVVVLIIAIIAVALAPQVTKWVQQAKENTEKSNIATLKSVVQTVTTDAVANSWEIPAKKFEVKYDTSLTITYDASEADDVTDFDKALKIALANFTEKGAYEVTVGTDTAGYPVTVTK